MDISKRVIAKYLAPFFTKLCEVPAAQLISELGDDTENEPYALEMQGLIQRFSKSVPDLHTKYSFAHSEEVCLIEVYPGRHILRIAQRQ